MTDIETELQIVGQVDQTLPLADRVAILQATARQVRRLALQHAYTKRRGHIGSEYSVTEILVALYCSAMSTRSGHADRLILSKGHAAFALYATLAAAGRIDAALLEGPASSGALPGHPVAASVPGVDATTGSLGHGLSIGVGLAIGARMDSSLRRTFVILGDGELQEGSNWEAIMLAAHLRLSNLIAIVDANGLQQGAAVAETNGVEPLSDKFEAFGWQTTTVDGHDFAELLGSLLCPPSSAADAPLAIIARTTKGYPISFMMDNPAWHHRIPTREELIRARAELHD